MRPSEIAECLEIETIDIRGDCLSDERHRVFDDRMLRRAEGVSEAMIERIDDRKLGKPLGNRRAVQSDDPRDHIDSAGPQ